MTIRLSKCALLAAIAFYYSLVVFNNLTDYESNHQFVEHVLAMDSIFPGSHEMWRAIPSPRIQTLFYISIIGWELVTAVLCWWGTARLLSRLRAPAPDFEAAKPMAIGALTLGCLMWFVAFISVGGEWFLMWQSKTWNGQEAAFQRFAISGIILIYLAMPEMRSGSVSAAGGEEK
jgi:predicted small integral membrane protein